MAAMSGILAAGALASAQGSTVHGTFEQYLETDPNHTGVLGALSYLNVQADLSPRFRLVASAATSPYGNWLDETYLQVDGQSMDGKLGRFRAPFGFNTWSDQYYTPFIGLPMIRSYYVDVVPGVSLYQLDRGAEVEGWSGPFQYQVSAVDSRDDDWHVYPNRIDTGVVRLQFSAGAAMVGLDGFEKLADGYGPAEQIGGLDFRYSLPRTLVRAEYINGSGGLGAKGYYADVFYRPPKLARTQLGLRVQGVETHMPGGYWDGQIWAPTTHNGQLYSFAARQFLNQNFTLQVNYGAGNNIAEAKGLLGWSVQLQSTFRF